MWELEKGLISNLGYIFLFTFVIIKIKLFNKSFKNEINSKKDILILSLLFSIIGIMGTYLGIEYKGSIVNIRNVSIVVASITCGPIVGGIAGCIAGIHRLLYGVGQDTAVACSISTILSGILPGTLCKKYEIKNNYVYSIFCLIAIESFSMILISISTPSGKEIISNIYVPMIFVNSLGICMMITILDNILIEKERIKYENMAHRAEIKALQTQINPHFLFNSLNTIISFVRIDPDKARELIINLSDYLRYNLEFKNNMINLKEEIEQVKAYVSIQQARFPKRISMHYDITNEDMNIKIPPLTIEPLVENAIKHGILKNSKGSNVWIKCKRKKDYTIIIVQDDGCGIEEDVIRKIKERKIENNRIGLYNVHSRIELIYGQGLNIKKLDNGTQISFKINNRHKE